MFNPESERDGFQSAHTLVMVVTDDMPFLVDSLGIVFGQAEIAVHLIVHPVLVVERDRRGRLTGVRVEREAVLGAGVVVTATTPIVDVRGEASVRTKGRIPARAIVIPGMLPKQFPAGAYATPCALIVGTRNESTDLKTSLNAALREHDVAV